MQIFATDNYGLSNYSMLTFHIASNTAPMLRNASELISIKVEAGYPFSEKLGDDYFRDLDNDTLQLSLRGCNLAFNPLTNTIYGLITEVGLTNCGLVASDYGLGLRQAVKKVQVMSVRETSGPMFV